MADDDYLALLDRAKNTLPETIEKHERFQVPEPDVFQEGKITVIRNFLDIADILRRDPQHLLQYLLRELGAPGQVEGRRAVLKAKIPPAKIDGRIQSYTTTFVLCSECDRPDTRIVREGRTMVLECDACGAHRPVKTKKAALVDESKGLKAGDVIEVLIQDLGRKGDGLAKKDGYVIYVPGTVKGARIKAKVLKVQGTNAYGQLVIE